MQKGAQKGLFITLEGGEGSGKSTQISKVKVWLEASYPDRELIITREPGGTPSAEDIRALLVTGNSDRLTPKTDALLMLASRVEHVERLILPALSRGAIVISDRFADSSFVYQTITGGYSEAELRDLHHLSIGAILPDRTYLMDLSPAQGLARADSREVQTETRFESKGLGYHQQVREAYLGLATAEADRFCVIDAQMSEDDIFYILKQDLKAILETNISGIDHG